MPPHAARGKRQLRVIDHRRVAAQHCVRVFGGKRKSRARLEAPVDDRRGNAAAEAPPSISQLLYSVRPPLAESNAAVHADGAFVLPRLVADARN